MSRKSRKQRRKNRKVSRSRKSTRKQFRKRGGGFTEGFEDRVPDKALVVVRDADDEESPFVIVTKEEAMKNLVPASNRY